MSRAVRLSQQYAAAWITYPDGRHHPWLLELGPSFDGLLVGTSFEVPDGPPPPTPPRPPGDRP
ncbi:hypothetical protein AB2L28_00880 [Kineococcus sp. TBRC 1896]|uniref:Uncharacterized protein n=1 Tax=Kineococcus mangrovi TaxID=1660183 RepID=A0ABV4HWJ5_9ACTN